MPRKKYRETSVQSKKGTHWYNNGEQEIMLYDTEEVPEGFVKGKIKGNRTKTKIKLAQNRIAKMKAELDILKLEEENEDRYKNMGKREKNREKAIAVLKQCWANGATDKEACQVAGIHYNTLSNWLHGRTGTDGEGKVEGLIEERDLLKTKPSYKARTNVVGAIDEGDIETSKWYLERKNPDEFSTKNRQEIDVTSGGKSIEEKEKEILEALANIK